MNSGFALWVSWRDGVMYVNVTNKKANVHPFGGKIPNPNLLIRLMLYFQIKMCFSYCK